MLHPERKTLGVLSYLALEGPTHRSKLAGLLWPDSDEKTARNNLAQVMRRLKKATETALILGEGGDILSLSNDLAADVAELKVLVFAKDPRFLVIEGELLATCDYDDCPDFADWVFAERERLQSLRHNALNEVIQSSEKQGDYKEALHYAETRLHLDTLSEEAHRQVMRLHFLTGDRAAAIKAFEKCKEVLSKELGVEPLNETRELAAEIEFGSLVPVTAKPRAKLPLRVLRPPLIGRENFVTQMDDAWHKSQAIILRGESGVGKSRLLKDFLDSKGAYTLLEGRPGDRGVPYSTQSRILRQVLSLYKMILEPWQKKELSRLVPELGETPEPLTSETDQLRFYDAQASVFQHAFEKGMNVIAIDDLQFFDDASFKALHFILSKYWGKPYSLQTVLSYRRNELNTDLETLLKDTLQSGSSILLEVTPLDESQVQTLVNSLGIANLEPLQKTLHGYTGGNPLFMIETIKSVLESESPTLKLPSSSKVQTLLKQRLDKLSQPALRLAWTAAVAQADFSLELASHVTQQSPFDLAEPLSELEQRSIFTGERFRHDLIFETALASIAAPVKTYLHKQTAEYLEKQLANPARIANHYFAANNQNKALPFLQQAAKIAQRDFQFIDAAIFYEQIANILETQNKLDEAFNHLYEARLCLSNTTLYEKIEIIIKRMLSLAQSKDQHVESHHAHSEYFNLVKGDFIAAEHAAYEGLKVAETAQHRKLLLEDLGVALWYQNRLTEAVEPLREVVKIDRELDSRNLGVSLANLSIVLQYLGHYRETLDLQEEAIAFLRQRNLQYELTIGLTNYAITLGELGYTSKSVSPLKEALNLQKTMQGTASISTTLSTLSTSHLDLCQFNDALIAIQKALEIAKSNSDVLVNYYLATLAHIYLRLGQSSLAKKLLDKSMVHLPEFPIVRFTVFREHARWLIAQGQFEQAHVALDEAKQALGTGLRLHVLQLLEAPMVFSPRESFQLAKQVLDYAKEGELKGGLALGALTRCAQVRLKLDNPNQALEYSHEAITLLKTYEPYGFYLGEIHLTHYQALKACKDKIAKDYLKQTLAWLIDIADNHVPTEYRESFLNINNVNKEILEAARLEGLLESNASG